MLHLGMTGGGSCRGPLMGGREVGAASQRGQTAISARKGYLLGRGVGTRRRIIGSFCVFVALFYRLWSRVSSERDR